MLPEIIKLMKASNETLDVGIRLILVAILIVGALLIDIRFYLETIVKNNNFTETDVSKIKKMCYHIILIFILLISLFGV